MGGRLLVQSFYKIMLLLIILTCSVEKGLAAPNAGDIQQQENFLRRQEQAIAAKEAEQESQKRSREKLVKLKTGTKELEKIELPAESISFPIQEIQVQGRNSEHFKWIQKYVQQYEGQKIGMQGITLLLKK